MQRIVRLDLMSASLDPFDPFPFFLSLFIIIFFYMVMAIREGNGSGTKYLHIFIYSFGIFNRSMAFEAEFCESSEFDGRDHERGTAG